MEAVAKLRNYPTSPRRMRLLADEIRGVDVEKALALLEFHPQHSATPLLKLLKSAINNWEQKNTDEKVEDAGLVVKTIMVDCGRVIKRMRPAPQGRGYRIRKRSNHVTIVVDSIHSIQNGSGKKKEAKKEAASVEEKVVAEKSAPAKAKKATPKKAAPKAASKAKTKAEAGKSEKKKEDKKTTK